MASNYKAERGTITTITSPIEVDIGATIGVTRKVQFENNGTVDLLFAISETDNTDYGDDVLIKAGSKNNTELNVKLARITLVGMLDGEYQVIAEGV